MSKSQSLWVFCINSHGDRLFLNLNLSHGWRRDMNLKLIGSLLLSSALLLASPILVAEEKHHEKNAHHDKSAAKNHHGEKSHKKAHKKSKGHNFSPAWSKTLSKEQRVAVDKMHLDLNRQHAVLKAKATLLQKELNVMTAQEEAKQSAIHAKIDKLMALKAKIMKLRYDHLSEMRAALTEQQRISYDMAILKREGAK